MQPVLRPQWREQSKEVMRETIGRLKTSHAAAFWVSCRGAKEAEKENPEFLI